MTRPARHGEARQGGAGQGEARQGIKILIIKEVLLWK